MASNDYRKGYADACEAIADELCGSVFAPLKPSSRESALVAARRLVYRVRDAGKVQSFSPEIAFGERLTALATYGITTDNEGSAR